MIETQGLSRSFNEVIAVNDLSLEIPTGQLYGLIGPDGAGKTTTLRLLAGLLKISQGQARIAGHSLVENPEAVKPHIGYMAQEFSLYAELTVSENLRFFSALYDLAAEDRRQREEHLLEFAGLTEFRGRRAAHLSGGMKKKLALACTLIHQPRVLLLDEPTTGVDPVSRRQFWQILNDLNLQGTTILVTTPYMDEADRCQQVGLMYQGQLIISEAPAEIRKRLPGEVVRLVPEDWRRAREVLSKSPSVIEIQTYGEALHLIVDKADERLPEIESVLSDQGLSWNALETTAPRMEEAFISLIRDMGATGKEAA